jgi:osmotically-inducible protein OsmY
MTIFNIRFVMVAILALSVAACGRSGSNTSAANDADNTARNERDKNEATKTPGDQSENADDLAISANVRKAIEADDSLSSNAHNVKIVTNAGAVTLRGPVKSAQEKAAVELKAKQVAGVTSVENLLEVEANP